MKPEDLRGHDLLTPEPAELPEFRLLLSRGRAARRDCAYRPSSRSAIRRCCTRRPRRDSASASCPRFLCRQGLATGRLKAVLPDWTAPPAAALHALYPAALEADTRVRRFVDFLAASVVPALAAP